LRNLREEHKIMQNWKGDISNPLVSICCITYNHEKFIEDSLEGFLIQETDFPFEILIHDDASTDKTASIIREYEKKYPDVIKAIYQKENQYSKGIKPSVKFNYPRAKGKYIALCEGDDYWIDPLKLQKQVAFLEANPEYVMCYHNAKIIDENGDLISQSKLPNELKRDFSKKELIQGKMILTLTICFRNILRKYPDEIYKVLNGDKFLTSLLGNFGKGKYMPDIDDAVYRKQPGAIWSKLDQVSQIYHNGVTRAWLHRYYKRIGEDKYAGFFKKDLINHFTIVLQKIALLGNHQHGDIISDIFTNYTDILYGESERQLRDLLNLTWRPLNGRSDAPLEYWLNKKGWQGKKELYSGCFESVTFQKDVNKPDISVIVISWRLHPDNLKNFQILEKQRDQNFELIFVDNGGKEGEFDCLKPFVDTYVRLNKNTGAYLARNVGAVFAKAPILLFLEDDGIPESNLIEAHLNLFKKYDIIACRGVYSPKTENLLNKMATHYYMGRLPYPYPSNLEGNSSYCADTFYKVAGWDDEILFGYGGWDLAVRLLNLEPDQRKQIYSPDPIIYHDFATSDEHLSSKREKQITSLKRLRRKHSKWDAITASWNKFANRHDVLILKDRPVSEVRSSSIITQGLLASALRSYEHGNIDEADRFLANYIKQFKDANL
jgi:glycosyltransferase involved in cell wall biosynthesis